MLLHFWGIVFEEVVYSVGKGHQYIHVSFYLILSGIISFMI